MMLYMEKSKVRQACGESVFISVGKAVVLRQVTGDELVQMLISTKSSALSDDTPGCVEYIAAHKISDRT